MKQHITVEQLNEAHIMDTLNLAVMLDIPCDSYKDDAELDKMVSERMTIGEMIDILYNYDCDVTIQSAGAMWYVEVAAHIDTQATELVDALWKAVKEVL